MPASYELSSSGSAPCIAASLALTWSKAAYIKSFKALEPSAPLPAVLLVLNALTTCSSIILEASFLDALFTFASNKSFSSFSTVTSPKVLISVCANIFDKCSRAFAISIIGATPSLMVSPIAFNLVTSKPFIALFNSSASSLEDSVFSFKDCTASFAFATPGNIS